jgi:hypothetical protein
LSKTPPTLRDSAPQRFSPRALESRNAQVVRRHDLSSHVATLFEAAEKLDVDAFKKAAALYDAPKAAGEHFEVRTHINKAYRGHKNLFHRLNLMEKSPAETILNRVAGARIKPGQQEAAKAIVQQLRDWGANPALCGEGNLPAARIAAQAGNQFLVPLLQQ